MNGRVLGSFARASGATFLRADLFLSCSRSLHLVVRMSIVSVRSFLSVTSSVIFRRQASRLTLRFSFSNSSGVRAGPFALLFLAIGFVLETDGAISCGEVAFAVLTCGLAAINGVVKVEDVDAVGDTIEEEKGAGEHG